MNEKKIFYCELAYVIGIIVLALGTVFMEKANFGMSMVVAPAYILYLKLSQILPWFSFGMSEYCFQFILLIILSFIMRKFRISYLLSFVTAFVYGIVLDVFMDIFEMFPYTGVVVQSFSYVIGLFLCTTAISLLLHAHFPPEAYELFVKEISQKTNISIGRIKTIYDFSSCLLGIALSLIFFKSFVGVSWGTVFCTFVNGWMIGRISRVLDNKFIFRDAFSLKRTNND